MKKIKNFCMTHQEILWAAGLLLIVAILGINCGFYKIWISANENIAGVGRPRLVFAVLTVLLIMGTATVSFLLIMKREFCKKHFVKISAMLVAVFALIYMFVMPPFSCCDEKYHFLGAYHLSNQLMGIADDTAERHTYVRTEDADFLLHEKPGVDDYVKIFSMNNWKGNVNSELVLFEDEKYYDCFIIGYLPQALGITIGRLLGLRQLPLMMLARFFSLTVFLTFFILAMRKLPFGREFMALVALFPMVLELVSGISYDGIVLGLSFYFIAYVLNLTFMAEKVRIKDMIILTAVMTFLAPIKVVYLLLAFLMFFIPKVKFGSTKKYIISALTMVAVIGTFFLLFRLSKFAEYAAGDNTYLEYADTSSYTLSQILGNPLESVKVLVNTAWYYTGYWFENMFGAQLGWVDIELPSMLVFGFAILLFISSMRPAEEPVFYRAKHRVISWLIFGAVSFAVVLSMMVAWTPADSPIVLGVQGRYFLPVLPLAIFAVRGHSFRRNENTDSWIIIGAVLLNVLAFFCIYGTVMIRMGENV